MNIKDDKFVFSANELKKLIQKIMYVGYKKGLLDAGEQIKMIRQKD